MTMMLCVGHPEQAPAHRVAVKKGLEETLRKIMVKERKPNSYWTDETIIAELKSIIAQIGHFPTGDELRDLKHAKLETQIHRHGGTNKFRGALGFPVLRKRDFWTEERILIELKNVIETIGQFPTSRELRKNKCGDLDGQITCHGGLNGYRQLLGYELPQKRRGYWTKDTTLAELKKFIDDIGHFPKREEFIAKKKQDLETAIKKYGGTNEFRRLLGYDIIQQTAGYYTEDIIIAEIKQVISKTGHFPVGGEVREHAGSWLDSAINNMGGINYFRTLMGYELSRKSPNYWTEETTLIELKQTIDKLGHFPAPND